MTPNPGTIEQADQDQQEMMGQEDRRGFWWAHQDLNLEPTDYESAALTVELWAQSEESTTVTYSITYVQTRKNLGSGVI